MVPPDIVIMLEDEVNPKPGELEEEFPTVVTLIVPPLTVSEQAELVYNLPEIFTVPPSKMNFEVVAPPMALPVEVPMLYVPLVTRKSPDMVGEPLSPATVKVLLFSQSPAVEGTE